MKRTLLLLSLMSLVLSYGCSSKNKDEASPDIQQEESSSYGEESSEIESSDQMMEDQTIEDQRMEDSNTTTPSDEQKVEEKKAEDAMDS